MIKTDYDKMYEIAIKNDQSFGEWYNFEASEEDRQLCDKAYSFEDLFNDMKFTEGTAAELMQLNFEDGSFQDEYYSEGFMDISLSSFRYKVVNLEEGTNGQFDGEAFLLSIAPECVNEDSVLLHEMIHLYEMILNNYPLFFHDMMLYSLYSDLKNKLPDLDELIKGHAHILTQENITRNGGIHDILFLLKSFDLDLRRGYPLGTVFGYGRADEYKEYRESE